MDDVFPIAKEFAKLSNYSLNIVNLQNLLFISQLLFIGEIGKKLFSANIVAGNYYPIIPVIYDYFLEQNIDRYAIDSFYFRRIKDLDNESKKEFIQDIWNSVKGLSEKETFYLTVVEGGAWKTIKKNGRLDKTLSANDLKQEYETVWKE